MNQATSLQVWRQSPNSPTTDSSTIDAGLDSRIDSSTVQSALYQAAVQLQAHLAQEEGELYRLEDLQQVLVRWLESSIECLVEDALFHTLEGDRAFAFNRHAFERQMQHLEPLSAPNSATTSAANPVTGSVTDAASVSSVPASTIAA